MRITKYLSRPESLETQNHQAECSTVEVALVPKCSFKVIRDLKTARVPSEMRTNRAYPQATVTITSFLVLSYAKKMALTLLLLRNPGQLPFRTGKNNKLPLCQRTRATREYVLTQGDLIHRTTKQSFVWQNFYDDTCRTCLFTLKSPC